jgi:hypothetical protein
MDSAGVSKDTEEQSVASADNQTLQESVAALDITPKDPADVLARCNVLLDELKRFADYCDQRKYLTEYRRKVEFSHFKGDIVKEIEQMQKVCRIPNFEVQIKLIIIRSKSRIYLQDEYISLLRLQT